MKKIAVFTSGGDAPGMNACIRASVRVALDKGLEVIGILQGYQGMIEGKFVEMESFSVSNIIQRGGTILKSSRSQEFMTKEGRAKAMQQIKNRKIEGIIAIGGNGTYKGAAAFYEEHGIPIIGVPGTIDNDLYGTDFTIGYDTAINTALDAVDKIRDTADSHDRMFFVEVMGRDAGYIALDVGISGGAEAILVPEIHTDLGVLTKVLERGWDRKKHSQIIIVAEGDDAGGVMEVVQKVKMTIPALDCRVVILGHIQRGGSPTARDRVLGSRLGSAAVHALLEGRKCDAVGIVNNKIKFNPLAEVIKKKKKVDNELLELADVLSR